MYENVIPNPKHNVHVGKIYNRWEVLEIMPQLSPNGYVLCKARCTCPRHTVKIRKLSEIVNGRTRSCGCLRDEESSARKTIDLSNRIFGMLRALYRTDERDTDGSVMWVCQCRHCGHVRLVSANRLRQGATKTCPSCRQDRVDSIDRLYHILMNMKQRCYNPNHPSYPNYGARGITICDEWRDKQTGFSAFYKWAMAHGYDDSLTIDRVDNDRGYCPENCRWANYNQQAVNRSNTHYITCDGVKLSLVEWCKKYNLQYGYMKRLSDDEIVQYIRDARKHKIEPHIRCSSPIPISTNIESVDTSKSTTQAGNRMITVRGVTMPIAQWATLLNTTVNILRHGHRNPRSDEQIAEFIDKHLPKE